jgi:hypothetical protein
MTAQQEQGRAFQQGRVCEGACCTDMCLYSRPLLESARVLVNEPKQNTHDACL